MSDKFKKIYDQSIKNPENFWQEASNDIFWFKKPTKILNKSSPPFYKWFEDGVTNTCYNALDIHIDQGRGKNTALIYDSPITGNKSKFTYEELRLKVSKFAGALKDHKRAIILGENSYGKGSVQSIIPLDNGGGMRLTISKYYLPSGKSISEVGVTPDILVEEVGDEFNIKSEKDNQLNYAIKLFNS